MGSATATATDLRNLIAGENFARACDQVFDPGFADYVMANRHMVPNVWFCKTDYIAEFFAAAGRAPNRTYIVVTHQSDYCITPRLLELMPANVVHWFGVNCLVDDPRVTAIPLGLADQRWQHGDWAAVAERVERENGVHHDISLLARFAISTNPKVRQRAETAVRELSRRQPGIVNETYAQVEDRPDFGAYLDRLMQSDYAACPAGNGPDTHRVWEALYMGSVPLIGPHAWQALSRLPIHDHVVLTRQWHATAVEHHFTPPPLLHRPWKPELLSMDYWRRLIQERATYHGI